MGVIEINWNYKINFNEIETKYSILEVELDKLREQYLQVLEDGLLFTNVNNQNNSAQTFDEKVKFLTEGNKELRQQIDVKRKDLSKQQLEYESCKKDQKLLTQQIKETHEAFLMAKKYYKKFLKMYFSIESRKNNTHVIFIQFFTEAKKDTDNYSVRFTRNTETGHYELQSVNLKQKLFKELQEKLKETNDLPGVVFCLRQAYLAIKDGKMNGRQ